MGQERVLRGLSVFELILATLNKDHCKLVRVRVSKDFFLGRSKKLVGKGEGTITKKALDMTSEGVWFGQQTWF